MGLFDEDKTETKPRELDADEIEYEKDKAGNRSVIIGSLVLSFIGVSGFRGGIISPKTSNSVSSAVFSTAKAGYPFIVGFAVAKVERSILDPFMQRLSTGLGAAFGTLLFAGIPALIAAKFTTKWRYVWLGITILLLVSQIVVFFYEKK